MRIEGLLPRQNSNDIPCLRDCPKPVCHTCPSHQECVLINRDCFSCPEIRCVDKHDPTGKTPGVSKGALAGGVVGAILFLALSVCLFLWYRRNARIRKAIAAAQDVKDVPAPASSVLNRPDPNEKPTPSPSVIDEPIVLQPPYAFQRDGSNPFDDTNSIQTAGTGGTNVIPIALVAPDNQQQSIRSGSDSIPSMSSGPTRPARSPEDNLNLDHVNVSKDNLRSGNYEASTISGVTSVRNSYMSGMTYASDFLTEAPMIMTPTKGPIRQIMGAAKPEVISAGNISGSGDTLKPPPSYTRGPNKSPLAATSFGPNDVLAESDEKEGANPFDDKHSSTNAQYSLSPPPTASTTQTGRESSLSNWTPQGPTLPWAKSTEDSRPSSMSTQAGSVIDISSATRVNVGLMTPGTASTTGPKPQFRTTMGRLISPSDTATPATPGSLQEQQARALAHAQAQAQAQGLDKPRPISGSSAISAASTRADSILESFPFVPPSPISNRPIRSPPVSPLAQQSFTSGTTSPLAQHTFVVAPPSPQPNASFAQQSESVEGALPAPPSRQTLGMSTASQLSTASTGLGSFPFHIDSGSHRPDSSSLPPPAAFNRQRASLDTLALTSDLSSYPLGFDREGGQPPKKDQR